MTDSQSNIKVELIYEDKDVVVVNKPSGLVMHADGKTVEPTLVDYLVEKYPDIKGVGESWETQKGVEIDRSGIVHRLDRETSGVLVVARTQEMFSYLKEQFQERSIEKHYRAFVYGILREKKGVIDRPIAKNKKDFRLWSAQRGARGELRDAYTEYAVLEQGNDAAYIDILPKTGRTHQIRVHFKAINHPVVCDRLYAPKQSCILSFERLALHAQSLSFSYMSGQRLKVEAGLPKDFTDALCELSVGN